MCQACVWEGGKVSICGVINCKYLFYKIVNIFGDGRCRVRNRSVMPQKFIADNRKSEAVYF